MKRIYGFALPTCLLVLPATMIALTALCTGCSVNVDAEQPTLESVEQPLVSYVTGSWTKGQGIQILANWTDYFCFLSKVTGNFAGGGEWVDVYGSNGYWYISGAAQSAGLSATATCVNYRAFTNVNAGWTPASVPVSSNNALYVGPQHDLTWLSAIGGRFSGGAEYATVYLDASDWSVEAHSGGVGITARAVSARLLTVGGAIRVPSYFGTVSQTSPYDGTTYNNTDEDLGPDTDRICYLTRISGKFNGYGEWAEIKRYSGRWWLRTESSGTNNAISATAQCVSLN